MSETVSFFIFFEEPQSDWSKFSPYSVKLLPFFFLLVTVVMLKLLHYPVGDRGGC